MEVAQLVLEFVKALVWPLVVLVAIWTFRQRLHDLLDRITQFEGPGGVKAAFAEKLAEAREQLEIAGEEPVAPRGSFSPVPPTPSRDGKPPDTLGQPEPLGSGRSPTPPAAPPPGPDGAIADSAHIGGAERMYVQKLERLVVENRDRPAHAVIRSAKLLDGYLGVLGRRLALFPNERPTHEQVQDLLDYLDAPVSLRGAIGALRELRNATAHKRVGQLTTDQADEYAETVRGAIKALSRLARAHAVAAAGPVAEGTDRSRA